jgi:site-specific recombinase XerD
MYEGQPQLVVGSEALRELAKRTENFVHAAKSPATLKAYRSDWRDFEAWCRGHNLRSLPANPETVALYITDLASCSASGTITRRLTAITKAHQAAGFNDSPATTRQVIVGETLKGIRRTIGTAQKGKNPILTVAIRKIIEQCPEGPLGFRDRALLLTGFAGAFRRSELAAFLVPDLKFTEDGAILTVRWSKTDQEGAGREVGLPWGSHPGTCPVRALRHWLEKAQITAGPLFRGVNRHSQVADGALNKDSIGTIVKRAVLRGGFSIEQFAAHSLRSGHVTQASMNGVSEYVIMRQTGHRSTATLRKYIRMGEIFKINAAAGLGL